MKKECNNYNNKCKLNEIRDSVPQDCVYKQSFAIEFCTASKKKKNREIQSTVDVGFHSK